MPYTDADEFTDTWTMFRWMAAPLAWAWVCPSCENTGYTLTVTHAGTNAPPFFASIEPCFYPLCPWDAPPPLAQLQVLGMFRDVVRSPLDGSVMALSSFTGPIYR